MQTLREVIYDTVSVWGAISKEEMMMLFEKRFSYIHAGIVSAIVDSLTADGLLKENHNQTYSTPESRYDYIH